MRIKFKSAGAALAALLASQAILAAQSSTSQPSSKAKDDRLICQSMQETVRSRSGVANALLAQNGIELPRRLAAELKG